MAGVRAASPLRVVGRFGGARLLNRTTRSVAPTEGGELLAGIVDALLSESWAMKDEVAAVMVIRRLYPHCVIELIEGPAPDAVETMRLLRSKMRRCERGHFHVDPPATPFPRCTLGADE